jgi:hypothetical protein
MVAKSRSKPVCFVDEAVTMLELAMDVFLS